MNETQVFDVDITDENIKPIWGCNGKCDIITVFDQSFQLSVLPAGFEEASQI